MSFLLGVIFGLGPGVIIALLSVEWLAQEIRDHFVGLFITLLFLSIIGILAYLSRGWLLRRAGLFADRSMAHISDEFWMLATSVYNGSGRQTLERARTLSATVVSWIAAVQFRIWIVSTSIALLAALAGLTSAVAIYQQIELMEQGLRSASQQEFDELRQKYALQQSRFRPKLRGCAGNAVSSASSELTASVNPTSHHERDLCKHMLGLSISRDECLTKRTDGISSGHAADLVELARLWKRMVDHGHTKLFLLDEMDLPDRIPTADFDRHRIGKVEIYRSAIADGVSISPLGVTKLTLVEVMANRLSLESRAGSLDIRQSSLPGLHLRGDFRSLQVVNVTAPGLSATDAQMGLANFERSNLGCGSFRDANLRGAIFRNANLEGVDFKGATLSSADFSGSKLSSETRFDKADLGGAIGLSCDDLGVARSLSSASRLPKYLNECRFDPPVQEESSATSDETSVPSPSSRTQD